MISLLTNSSNPVQCSPQRCLTQKIAITEEVCGGIGREFCYDTFDTFGTTGATYTGAARCSSLPSTKYSDTGDIVQCTAPLKPEVYFFCSNFGTFPDITDCQK